MSTITANTLDLASNDPPVQAHEEVSRRSTTLFLERVAVGSGLIGTKIIARDMPGRGKVPSSQRFRAFVRVCDTRGGDVDGRAVVEVWSDSGWLFVEEKHVTLLPVADAQREPGEWEGAMHASLDELLVIGLDVVPC